MSQELDAIEKAIQGVTEDVASLKVTVKEGLAHPQPSAGTVAMIGELKDMFSDHLKASEKLTEDHALWKTSTDNAINQLNELMPIVREKLLPAYEKELQRDMFLTYAKERAKSVSFWLGVLATIGGFLYGVLHIIKQFLKP